MATLMKKRENDRKRIQFTFYISKDNSSISIKSENNLAWESTSNRMMRFRARSSPAYIAFISEVSELIKDQ